MEASQWYYAYEDRQVGPVSPQELGRLFRENRLGPDTLVWNQSLTGWVPAHTINGLVPPAPGMAPPPPIPMVDENYAPPLRKRTASYAGFWKRFCACILDTIILFFGGAVIGGFSGGIMGFILGASGVDVDTIQMIAALMGNVIGIVMNWLYFTLFESSARQATPGKMALGIQVTDLDGNRISFGKANGRYWGKLLSVLTLLFGYVMAGFTEKKQALHDMLSGCLVVNG